MKNKGIKKVLKGITIGSVCSVLLISSVLNAKIASGRIYIGGNYGYLTGETSANKNSRGEKFFNAEAKTSKVVSKIRAKLTVHDYKTGKMLGGDGETTGWQKKSKHALTCDIELSKISDKYIKEKASAYGTADAIQEDAYAVYTKIIGY